MIEPLIVAIQGELGSNSAQAAYDYFSKNIQIIPCRDFEGIFNAVKTGSANYAMAPVENSIAGSIYPVWDLLSQNTPEIIGEHYLLVRHNLIGNPETSLKDIRSAHSHEQALSQCAKYLTEMNIKPVRAYDTAGAVALIKHRGSKDEAAIATESSAQIHKMQVLAKDIQTDCDNYTRFVVIGKEQIATGTNTLKQTIIVDLSTSAKYLGQILSILSAQNLTKVETRKLIDSPWVYRCFIEFIKTNDENIEDEISRYCNKITILNPYPMALPPNHPTD